MCLQNAVDKFAFFNTVHINSTSFAACRFKDRDPTNVLRAGKASGTISASFDRTFRRRLFRGTELTRPLIPEQLHPRLRRDRHLITVLRIRVLHSVIAMPSLNVPFPKLLYMSRVYFLNYTYSSQYVVL